MALISFIGDIVLVDRYNDLKNNGENPFKDVEPILSKSDYVVGNLECLAESRAGENLLKKPRLKTKLKTLAYLKNIHLRLGALANNHSYDNLLDGVMITKNYLDNLGIETFGAGETAEIASKFVIKKINDIRFCFLNYVTEDTNPNLPESCDYYLNWFDEEKSIAEIKANQRQLDDMQYQAGPNQDNTHLPYCHSNESII